MCDVFEVAKSSLKRRLIFYLTAAILLWVAVKLGEVW